MSRPEGRALDALRPFRLVHGMLDHHNAHVVVEAGRTKVLVVCTVEDRVPPYRLESGGGWLTATYDMLLASTHTRRRKENGPDGRALEIQRLIGRALRASVHLDRLGQRTLNVDCTVLQADGGTRTAAITGGFVATALAVDALANRGALGKYRLKDVLARQVTAVSVGLLGDEVRVDLEYVEDAAADTDLNLVGTPAGDVIEVQGTAEGKPMRREQLDAMLDAGRAALQTLGAAQRAALAARDVVWDA